MKKLIPYFLIALFSIFIVSCSSDDNGTYIDNDTIAEVYEINNENFSLDQNYNYTIKRSFARPIYNSDMVLIYKQDGIYNNNPIWVLLPKTYYVNDGALDYTFDFTVNDIQIYADATFDLTPTDYIKNQTFRVVVVPAVFGRGSNTVDYNDYNSVVNFYNLKGKSIKAL